MSPSISQSLMRIAILYIAAAILTINADASPLFRQNNHHVAFNLGFVDALQREYVGFGMGYRYFPIDGVEIGMDFDLLLGNNPLIYTVSPEIRYVFYPLKTFVPYVGAYYQYNYINNMENRGGLGARAGFYTPLGPQVYIAYGVSLGELTQCNDTEYGDCSPARIELSIALSF